MSVRELLERAGVAGTRSKTLLAAVTLCALTLGWAGMRWLGAGGNGGIEVYEAPEGDAGVMATATPGVTAAEEETVPPTVWVHIVGAVLRPGVYEVAEGARVADVVELAGGLTGSAEQRGVNLARGVTDGEQVVVLTQDEFETGGGTNGMSGGAATGGSAQAPPSQPAPAGPVNVNTADAARLETLPGIGPATAAKIISDREQNGPFGSVQDLLRVSGIGERKLEALVGLVTVG